MNIQHIFFDLDHTLWDFDKNAALAFQQIFSEQNISLEVGFFLEAYMPINLKYWKLYREDKISRESLKTNRLKDAFDALNYNISQDLITTISDKYIAYLPTYNHLFEGTIEVLDYLKQKYHLHIITNGFDEVQNLKLQKSGIASYFQEIITSQSIGLKKPNPKVFEFALNKANTIPQNALMIGDSYEADILGALNSGMLAIHFANEHQEYQNKTGVLRISNLIELKTYL
ncbi:YjjG family noncanonical pyrimidine nucleotidase [Tenacibaculum piscium]|uniref:YjjG family noncanonical pyrimidine nucleotidase n=1 Tax=Tenacibaculum piscium TaxID=1458515 RepID=UPI001EFB66A2|nr:YjjG family noncanonical pyrimidine nucleotidase [Tenacibaculum piscium]MCG8183540.1 YjjG family noncanonical pyrimidine nucleotidase [Tenacibaculum piscium]MCG8204973.1 YjjG family noncanonical pyrimidine nucleotidase [Tenacibaculum piscium]